MRKLIVMLVAVLAAVAVLPATAATAATTGLTVTARRVLLADNPASVVLVGRYSCGPFASGAPLSGTVDLNVDQVTNGVTAHAIGYLTPTACDGAAHWFVAELTSVNGATFRRANATWTGSGYVQGQEAFQNVYVPPTRVRIS